LRWLPDLSLVRRSFSAAAGAGGGGGLVLLEVADQHLELVGLGRQLFGGPAVAVAPQRRQLHLQLLDLEARIAQLGIAFGQCRVTLRDQRIALRQQGAQRLDVVRECRGVELGGHA
jgi:hypothetical protein